MSDLLQAARKKCEILTQKAEEITDINQAATRFIGDIQAYRGKFRDTAADFDDFIAYGNYLAEQMNDIRQDALRELEKVKSFIALGEQLLSDAEAAGDAGGRVDDASPAKLATNSVRVLGQPEEAHDQRTMWLRIASRMPQKDQSSG